ncbi:MAG: hypothetical protein HY720_12825 [Planctomycetes bacterium]|nr:hypothetical protein [Planctomycetota bacterium]
MTPKTPPPSECTTDPEAEARFVGGVGKVNEGLLEVTAALMDMAKCGHWKALGAGSVGEFGERKGLSYALTRACFDLASVIEGRPELEEKVRSSEKPAEAVAALLPLIEEPALLEDGETLVSVLERRSTKGVRSLVRERRIERKDTTRRHRILLALTENGVRDLGRVMDIESARAQESLDVHQTVERVLREHRERHDLLGKPMPARRMGDTRGRPGRPKALRVKWWEANGYGGKCLVDLCDHTRLIDSSRCTSRETCSVRGAPQLGRGGRLLPGWRGGQGT